MKRIMYLVIIIVLPLLAYFQYDHYLRHHPPVDCAYPINEGIDAAYHDPEVVLNYYEKAEATGTYARHLWKEYKIDVKHDNPSDGKAAQEMLTYRRYLATAHYLEGKLLQSAAWKTQGFTNEEIRYMEQHEVGPETMRVRKLLEGHEVLKMGAQNQAVMNIQKLLLAKGYSLRIDGLFDQETLQTVQIFQESRQLFPSGMMDEITLKELLK
jgi:murein L,D-transpeptidase YcbB/YkuD